MTRTPFTSEMKGGEQLDLFAAAEPEPATTAGPAPADPSSPGDSTTVVDLHGRQGDPLLADPQFVYVGRPLYRGGWKLHGHLLSNPYTVGKDGTAEQVVERYRKWLVQRRGLTHQLLALRGRVLGCWCADGQPCHARVLAEMADGVVDA